MVQTGDNHDDADGLGASIYMEGCSRGLKQIKIAGKDGDDVVIVPQSAARQSRLWADLLVEDKGHSYGTWLDVNRRAPSVPAAFGAFGCLGEVSQLFSFGFLLHASLSSIGVTRHSLRIESARGNHCATPPCQEHVPRRVLLKL